MPLIEGRAKKNYQRSKNIASEYELRQFTKLTGTLIKTEPFSCKYALIITHLKKKRKKKELSEWNETDKARRGYRTAPFGIQVIRFLWPSLLLVKVVRLRPWTRYSLTLACVRQVTWSLMKDSGQEPGMPSWDRKGRGLGCFSSLGV